MALVCFLAEYASSAARSYSIYVSIGLALSSVGDFALELNGSPLAKTPSFAKIDLFLVGLVSFLVAHVLYIRAFLLDPAGQPLLLPGVSSYLFYSFGAAVFSLLRRRIPGPLRMPTLVYIMVIATMGHRAFTRYHHVGSSSDVGKVKLFSESGLYGMLGALSFMVSDTVLAFDKFYAPMSWAKLVIMVTYYAGQYGIALSAIAEATPE
jgi:uncharacterized membrane protein YhhN